MEWLIASFSLRLIFIGACPCVAPATEPTNRLVLDILLSLYFGWFTVTYILIRHTLPITELHENRNALKISKVAFSFEVSVKISVWNPSDSWEHFLGDLKIDR